MRKMSPILALLCAVLWAPLAQAQDSAGALDFLARVTPTAARPEPVRQFTFYVLTKSYADITREVEGEDVPPTREKFIDDLKVSPELKTWLKAHEVFDLTMPGVDKQITPDDVIHIPEFLAAYQVSNSGGVTNGLPKPKYAEADKTSHPDRYEKQKQEYLLALKKFVQAHPETESGIELELTTVNPQSKWSQVQTSHFKRVQRMAPEVAQTKYLAGKMDTDLDGHGGLSSLRPGTYWISTLGLDVDSGDTRLRWDVPVTIEAGRTTRIELTNLNATDAHAPIS